MPDINYFSISQDLYSYNSGSNFVMIADEIPKNLIPSNPKDYSDILKISNQKGIILENIVVAQGVEDSVDINNKSENITLSGEFGIGGGGSQVFTIKGGSRNINIYGVCHGNKIEIGNWSDQTYKWSENIFINLKSVNGQKIKVAIGWGKNVTLTGDCIEDKVGGWKIKIYCYLKSFARKILSIKEGEKGPNWM